MCFLFVFAVGTELGQDTIESAGVFLFKTFHNKEQVGHEETRAIKQMFGPFPASAAELSCAAVGRLVAQIGECHVEAFIQTHSSLKSVDRSAIFGRNIAFSFDTYVLDVQDTGSWTEESDMDVDINFHNFVNYHVGEQRAERDDAYSLGELVQGETGSSILRQEVEKYLNEGNMVSSSVEELSTSLFEMLASTKSDDELQNEVTHVFKLNLKFDLIALLWWFAAYNPTFKVRNLLQKKDKHLFTGDLFICCDELLTIRPPLRDYIKKILLGVMLT